MAEYNKNIFSDIISVESIITVLHVDLKGKKAIGEAHDFWEFLYVDKGTHKVTVDNTVYEINEGQLIMYSPLAFHSVPEPSEAKVNIVSFETSSPLMEHFKNNIITLSGKQRRILSQIMETGEKCLKVISPNSGLLGMVPREGTPPAELQNLKNQLELLLIDMYEKNESTSSKPQNSNYENQNIRIFNTITQYMKENITKSLTLDDICHNCAISISQLKNACRSQCGMSPISYFISLKLDEAKNMITDTDLNFTEISERLGFATVHYFSRLFKNKTGLTPSQYAKSVYKNKGL